MNGIIMTNLHIKITEKTYNYFDITSASNFPWSYKLGSLVYFGSFQIFISLFLEEETNTSSDSITLSEFMDKS